MSVTVFCSTHWQALQEKALQLWRKWTRSDASPFLLVPTNSLRRYWLSVFAKEFGGIAGDRILPLDTFASQLLMSYRPALVRRARALEERLAAQAASMKANLTLDWQRPGILDAFLSAVEELELHGLSPDSFQKALTELQSPTMQQVLCWWKAWKVTMQAHSLQSVGDVLNEAAEKVERGELTLPPVSGVLVYGFTALSDARWRFLTALLQHWHKTDCPIAFFVLCDPDDLETFSDKDAELSRKKDEGAFAYLRPFVKRLEEELGAQVCSLESGVPEELKRLPRFLFRRHPIGSQEEELSVTDRIVCLAAAGEEQEIELVLRLLTYWRRSGKLARWSDVLVVLPTVRPYLPAIEAVSYRYGIPFREATEEPLFAHTGLINLLWEINEGVGENWLGESLWKVLSSPHLRQPSNEGEPLLPPKLRRPLLKFLRERWVGRWAEISQDLKKEFPDEPAIPAIFEFLTAVSELPERASARNLAVSWQRWWQRFVRPLTPSEVPVLQQVNAILNQLKGWSVELSRDEFVEILASACQQRRKVTEDAIQIAPLSDAIGRTAPVVVLVGLRDGIFPSLPPAFEFLTDPLREALTKRCGLRSSLKFRRRPSTLPFATDFMQEQRLLLAQVLGIATERLVLSYTHTDAEGKPVARSLFLDEVENALAAAGYQWQEEEQDIADVVVPVSVPEEEKATQALPSGLKQAIDWNEASVGAVFAAFSSGLSDDACAVAANTLRNDGLRRRLHTEWLRWHRPQEGPWDGKGLRLDAIGWLQRKGEIAVTALETYGKCPYHFFAERLLNLQRPKEVAYEVAKLDWGVVWHEILQEFLRKFIQEGSLPEEDTLHRIAQRVVERRSRNWSPDVRNLFMQQVKKLVPSVWRAEEKETREGWQPEEVEKEMAMPATYLGDLPQDLHSLQISPRIDRVDSNAKGEWRIVDYKTGDPPSLKDIRAGTSLQLPLYALALQREGKEVVAAMFLTFDKDRYSKRCQLAVHPEKRQIALAEAITFAKYWGHRFLYQIAACNFTVFPYDLEQSCRFCSYRALCRRHPLRLRERKETDECISGSVEEE